MTTSVADVDGGMQRVEVTRILLLAAGCVALQAVLSGFGVTSHPGTWLWFALLWGLLWLVLTWHSQVARTVLVVVSLLGVLLTAVSLVGQTLPLSRGLLLVAVYALTAWLLVRPSVRQHTREAPDR